MDSDHATQVLECVEVQPLIFDALPPSLLRYCQNKAQCDFHLNLPHLSIAQLKGNNCSSPPIPLNSTAEHHH